MTSIKLFNHFDYRFPFEILIVCVDMLIETSSSPNDLHVNGPTRKTKHSRVKKHKRLSLCVISTDNGAIFRFSRNLQRDIYIKFLFKRLEKLINDRLKNEVESTWCGVNFFSSLRHRLIYFFFINKNVFVKTTSEQKSFETSFSNKKCFSSSPGG